MREAALIKRAALRADRAISVAAALDELRDMADGRVDVLANPRVTDRRLLAGTRLVLAGVDTDRVENAVDGGTAAFTHRRHELTVNVYSGGLAVAVSAIWDMHTGGMKFYRSPLESGGFEYARDHGESGRVDYFDDELRIWVACESLLDEIRHDGTWIPCSEHEVHDPAEAWPGAAFDMSRIVG